MKCLEVEVSLALQGPGSPRQRAHAALLPHTVYDTYFLPRPPDLPMYRVPWDLYGWEQMSQTALQEAQLGCE